MFWLKYSRYVIACSLSASEVLSSAQVDGSTNSDIGLSQETDLHTTPSPPNQGSLIASQPDSEIPSDNQFNEITNKLHLAGIFSLPNSQQNPAASPVIEPNLQVSPPPASQNSALAPFDENGGLTNVIPSLPSFPQLNNPFPQQGNQNPDPKVPLQDTQTDANERKQPDCNDGKFAFCCQLGHPKRGPNIQGIPPEELQRRQRERKSRLRKCRRWKIDDPACAIPANEACCTCISKRQEAFFCYNPYGITSPPQPVDVPLLPDPNIPSSEPDPNNIPGIPQRRKRDSSHAAADDRITITGRGEDPLLVANANANVAQVPTSSWKRPGGRPRFESTCSDEFVESLGLNSLRYRAKPLIHTPENPFRYGVPRNNRLERPPDADEEEKGWTDGL